MIVSRINNPWPVWDGIKSFMTDDYRELDEDGCFLGVFDGEKMAGAFLIRAWNSHCFEVHGGVAKDYWGSGPEVCYELGKYLFDFTPCLKIVAPIPEYNRLMARCLKMCGLREEGRITKAYRKWFRLHDIILFGIQKQERGQLCQLYQ
jgi:RimJ/RimL family protein N-acetyltransferase